jgi:hypothetical protein
MKKISILLFCLAVCLQTSFAQTPVANTDYTIGNLKGVIKIGEKPVTKGQKVTVNDKVKFAKDAVMLLTNTAKTQYVVVEPSTITTTKIDLEAPLSTFLKIAARVPVMKPNQSVMRSTADMTQFFKDRVFVLGNELRLVLIGVELDEYQFFYVNAKYGTEIQNRQLDYKDSLLIVSKSLLLDATSKPIPDAEILKVNVDLSESESICKPAITFIDEPTTKAKMQTIADLYVGSNITKDNMPKEIANYIAQYYGKTDYDNLKYWVDKNLKL